MLQHILAPALVAFTLVSSGPAAHLPRSRNSVVMEIDESARPPPAMPAIAAEWGCDEATWAAVKSKRSLVKICDKGDKDHFEKRLVALKELIANPPSKPPPPAPKAGGGKKGKREKTQPRKDGPYVRYGGLPDAMDSDAITAKVNERSDAKVAKDYARADAIREELAATGVRIRDDMRTWSYKRPATPAESDSVE